MKAIQDGGQNDCRLIVYTCGQSNGVICRRISFKVHICTIHLTYIIKDNAKIVLIETTMSKF